MTALVLDATAALILLLGAPGRELVRDELRDRIVAGRPVLVTPLFWAQLVDALRSRGYPPRTIVEAVYELERLGVKTADMGRPGVLALVDAVGRGLEAGPAASLVLAEASDARLLTSDPVLAAIAGTRAVLAGAASRRRRPVADRSWVHWEGAGAYLRELRSSV